MKRRSSGSSDDGNRHADKPRRTSETDGARDDQQLLPALDRRKAGDSRPSSASARSRKSASNLSWKPNSQTQGSTGTERPIASSIFPNPLDKSEKEEKSHDGYAMRSASESPSGQAKRRQRSRSPWAISLLTLAAAFTGLGFLALILNSLVTRQIDPKGCRMSYMRPSYAKLGEFDTEHTRFASKYSLYLYREQGIDDENKIKGVPVLFIPGNAGSYKQVRPIAAEAANYFHDVLHQDEASVQAGIRSLDFFTVDFNEDITAFHGQTLLDQAEYLNEAVRYILSLYLDPRMAGRDAGLPDPTSVIILGHSMGGVVARTMLTMPNYQSNSINTIITMSAPHARPPVSFDSQIVSIYDEINDYWRRAYAQQWANNNPLWHVTLVSIAGGGLDTVVPSDYANLESLVPDTHGFTVFTTTIPEVWTSMDHQAILWCDQFRKAIAHALYDVVDVNRSSQTKPRAERMRVFKKWFLTGMEPSAEKTAPASEPSTLLTVEDGSSSIIAAGERLVLRDLGSKGKPEVHLLPVPPVHSSGRQRLTLLTDQKLDMPGELGKLEVLFCSVYPLQPGQASSLFTMNMDLSSDSSGSTRLACRNAAPDVIKLPASTPSTRFPFFPPNEQEIPPFSYLQYDVEDIGDNQFVAIVDKAVQPAPGFVLAEFSDQSQWHRTRHISPRRLLAFGIRFTLPEHRPMVTEVMIPSLESSLLAYNLNVNTHGCGDSTELFMPLVRQYLSNPYESKYFVNAKSAGVSIHGVAPYLPPPLSRRSVEGGLSFQFWTDPTCDTVMDVRLTVDVLGSLGKLYMRYRTIFASLPLLVVALVIRKQFRTYDTKGAFITFSESLDLCLRRSIPLMLASLTLLSLSAYPSRASSGPPFLHWVNGTSTIIDFHQNDLLIGTHDAFFWFIIPLAGVISVGACVVVNYAALLLTQLLGLALSLLSMRPAWVRHDERRRASSTHVFMPSSPRRRMITTAVLLLLVATFIPYQFAYLVACLVQLTTTVRAHRITSELRSTANLNFYNYVHSVFVLMLWILPVNLPVLVVWIHNLAVHWFTPFSSHHNVLSIMPFIILVETLTTGKMVPRVNSSLRHVTNLLLFGIALYAAVYGVTYAYMLHYLVNVVALWLVIVHSATDKWSLSAVTNLYNGNAEDRKSAKAP